MNRSSEFSSFFDPARIHVSPTGVVSSLSPPRYRLSSVWHRAHCCAVSRFLPIEPRWDRYLRFIFWQRFVPSALFSSQNWSIKFAPPPPATHSGPPDSHSTAIKRSSQPWPLCPPLNPPTVIVPFHRRLMLIIPLHNDTHNDKLANSLSLPEQLIDMWIHIKRYFEILQYHAGL
jgi:hypothetical protein